MRYYADDEVNMVTYNAPRKYNVKFQNPEDPFDNGLVRNREFDTREAAQKYCDEKAAFWQGIYTFSVYPPYEPPDWTPPTVTRIPLERTMMGSPCMGGDDDLLGVKPPC